MKATQALVLLAALALQANAFSDNNEGQGHVPYAHEGGHVGVPHPQGSNSGPTEAHGGCHGDKCARMFDHGGNHGGNVMMDHHSGGQGGNHAGAGAMGHHGDDTKKAPPANHHGDNADHAGAATKGQDAPIEARLFENVKGEKKPLCAGTIEVCGPHDHSTTHNSGPGIPVVPIKERDDTPKTGCEGGNCARMFNEQSTTHGDNKKKHQVGTCGGNAGNCGDETRMGVNSNINNIPIIPRGGDDDNNKNTHKPGCHGPNCGPHTPGLGNSGNMDVMAKQPHYDPAGGIKARGGDRGGDDDNKNAQQHKPGCHGPNCAHHHSSHPTGDNSVHAGPDTAAAVPVVKARRGSAININKNCKGSCASDIKTTGDTTVTGKCIGSCDEYFHSAKAMANDKTDCSQGTCAKYVIPKAVRRFLPGSYLRRDLQAE